MNHLAREWGHGGGWFESSRKRSFGDASKQGSYSCVSLCIRFCPLTDDSDIIRHLYDNLLY